MDAIQTTTASAANPQKPATVGNALVQSDFQTFLLMLTTQMQNQDPLNPIESSDYAVQLATFSGVEQQVKTNQLLEAMAAQSGLSGMGQLAGWVGMEARVAAPVSFDGAPLTLLPTPAPGADEAVLVTYDAQNREIAREAVAASDAPIVWAGTDSTGQPLPSGTYSFKLESYQAGQLVSADPVASYAEVVEVRTGATGATVVLRGGVEVAAADVTALRAPGG